MVQKSKKPCTKGSKQIIEENEKTLRFYGSMCLGSNIIYFPIMLVLFTDSFTPGLMALLGMAFIVYLVCYSLLRYAAKATYGEDGKVVDSGTDLNMEGGITEHVKDLLILTTGTQLLSVISNYFWFMMLLAPSYAVFLLWKSVLGPWFFQPAEEPKKQDLEEKRQKRNKYTVHN